MNSHMRIAGRLFAAALICAAVLIAASCAKPLSRAQIAEGLVDSMQKGDFAAATKHFDSTMTSQMSADKLKEQWTGVSQQFGAFKGRTATQETKEQGYDMVFVTCEFQKTKFDFKIVFGADNKVSGLWIVPSNRLQGVEQP